MTLDSLIPGWQKVADIYGKNVYVYAKAAGYEAFTAQQHDRELVIMVPTLTDEKLTPATDHGLGGNTPREYATPQGAGKRL